MAHGAAPVDSRGTAAPFSPQEAPMLMLVRDTDTAQAVQNRLAEQARTVTEMAAAPVRFVPPAFLAAAAGLFPQPVEADPRHLAAL
jgi:hypothetical protein